jgi:hypothetical protein
MPARRHLLRTLPPRIKLKGTQTIMQGAGHCGFNYTFDEP